MSDSIIFMLNLYTIIKNCLNKKRFDFKIGVIDENQLSLFNGT